MSLMLWNSSLSVNIQQVDLQHQRLVEMINKLDDSMKKGHSTIIVSQILNDMVAYSLVHFKTEEELFQIYDYPETEEHIQEHNYFTNKVEEFINEFNSGSQVLSLEVLNFLTRWFLEHIKIQDKAYATFLNRKGVV